MVKSETHTSGIVNARHTQAMLDSMETADCFDIALDYDGQKITSIVATIGKKKKEVFRALIGTNNHYLVRYDNRLFV